MYIRKRNTGRTLAAAFAIYDSLKKGKAVSVQGEGDDFVVKVKNIIFDYYREVVDIDIIFYEDTNCGKLDSIFIDHGPPRFPLTKVVGYKLTLKVHA